MIIRLVTMTRLVTIVLVGLIFSGTGITQTAEVDRLVEAILGDPPIVEDLRQLCDEIGAPPTGSEANLKSVEWALRKLIIY